MAAQARHRVPAAALALALAAPPAAADATPASRAYLGALRDYLIAIHCGLDDWIVRDGFRLEVMALHHQGRVAPREARALRERAHEEVRREWRLRGSGARDPRCRKEGRAAAERLRGVVLD